MKKDDRLVAASRWIDGRKKMELRKNEDEVWLRKNGEKMKSGG